MGKIGDATKTLIENRNKLGADRHLSPTEKKNLTTMIDKILSNIKEQKLDDKLSNLDSRIKDVLNLAKDVQSFNSNLGTVRVLATTLKAECNRLRTQSPLPEKIRTAAGNLEGVQALKAPECR